MLKFLGKLALPSAEIAAYHESGGVKTAFVIGGKSLYIVNVGDAEQPRLLETIDLGLETQSVAVNADGLVALALGKQGLVGTTQVEENINGVVQFHSWNGTNLTAKGEVTVGALPDSLAYNAVGTVIVVANEGEPNGFYTKDESSDPAGSISVIVVNAGNPAASTVTNLSFDGYNAQLDLLRAKGVRISGDDSADGIEGNLVSQDMEPEYVSITGTTAYVSTQENNAVIAVDISDPTAPSIKTIFPLGYKDWDRGIATTSNYDVAINYPGSSTSEPNDATGGAAGSIIAGGLSGLWWDRREVVAGNLTDILYTISDRGPQANDVPDNATNGAGEKLFNDPDFPITVYKLGFDGSNVSVLETVTLKVPDGQGGFRNSTGIGALPTHDLAFSPSGDDYVEVARDAFGLDSESVLRLTIAGLNGGEPVLAVSDEYFPQIALFDADSGNLIKRYVPADTNFSAVTYEAGRGDVAAYTGKTLPAVYSDRRGNRGFEGLAFNSDDDLLYAFIQSPMRPDGYANSTLRRILAIDPLNGEAKAEYLYLQTGPGNQDKIGDAVYDTTRGTFLAIDRDSGTTLSSNKSVLEFDLRNATNVLGTNWQDEIGKAQPEELSADALATALAEAGIQMVEQKDLFNLPSIGAPANFDKPEGLALTTDGRLFINYDNDFVRANGRPDNLLTEINFASLNVDTTDKDSGFDPGFRPFYGMRQADGTASTTIGGETFFFTANEGDGRVRPDDVNFIPGKSSKGEKVYFVEIVANASGRTAVPGYENGFTDDVDGKRYFLVESDEANGTEVESGGKYYITFKYGIDSDDQFYNDETRLEKYDDFSNLQAEAAAEAPKGKAMGRLKTLNTEVYLSSASADAEAPDQVIGLGGRSFSIFDSNGNVVYDSGNLTEMAAAISGSYDDGRSDDKGTEPETVTLGTIGGRTVALVALERTSNVALFDVTNPRNAQFLQILDVTGDSGLVSPEGITMAGSNVLIINEVEPGIAIYGPTAKPAFTLQLLHSSDNESNFLDTNTLENKVINYAAITDGLQDLAADRGWATLHITAGDHTLPGLFYEAGEEAYGKPGLGDIAIYNALGIQANGIGNHEMDGGIDEFIDMVKASNYVHLSANLNFTSVKDSSGNAAPYVSYGAEDAAMSVEELTGKIAPSAYIELNGQKIGLIGRSPSEMFSLVADGNLEGLDYVGGTTGTGTAKVPVTNPLDLVQAEINRLQTQGINKIIFIDHAQDYTDQPVLSSQLDGVDIIVQAGMTGYMSGDTPFGPFDLLRPEEAGDSNPVTDAYPLTKTDSQGKTVLITNTEQLWRYVGNLVVDFDAVGDIIGYDDLLSGPVPTTAEGVAAVKQFVPGSDVSPAEGVIEAYQKLNATEMIQEAFTKYGTTSNPLDGLRADVRSRETNLARLAADSTLWYANQYLEELGETKRADIALKNGGGIRDTITGPNILDLNIAAALAFDNKLTILDLTGAQFLAAVENGVSRVPALDGRYPHFAGVELDFDASRPGISGQTELTEASRVKNLAITRDDGSVVDLVRNFVANPAVLSETFTLATNNYQAGGGDGYQAFVGLPGKIDTVIGEQEVLATYIQQALGGEVTLSDATVIADPRTELLDPSSFMAYTTIGETEALIPQAGTSSAPEHLIDGESGRTDFPYGTFKALATIGEVDKETGFALTGYPDGNAAWLKDNDTIRVAYQSESYGTMSNETYGQVMESGAVFTGSKVHVIDYDRQGFADFLKSGDSGADIVEGSGFLFNTVYNVFGEVVDGKNTDKNDLSAKWGNQTLPDGTLVEFKESMQLTEGDFFFQSFCGSWYENANKYGDGIGFADDVYLMAEEWNIGNSMFDGGRNQANETMGLASMVVDIANETAYTVPALGQTGFEKILPINPGHTDYVVLVMSGYNHDQEPVPNRIYVGVKDKLADGSAIDYDTANERDSFLARNGLLHGKTYGLALDDTTFSDLGITADKDANGVYDDKVVDDYLKDAGAPTNFSGRFYATDYQWQGFDKPVAVKDTEMFRWEQASEQPDGYTFFNGDSKIEHSAVDPDISKVRFVQNMTDEGGILGFDLTNTIQAELAAANGALPEFLSVDVTRVLAAVDGALTLDTNGVGEAHVGAENPDGSLDASIHVETGRAKTVANDGLHWVKNDDGDFLILDEDSGNDAGERKMIIQINSDTMELATEATGNLLAIAGGSDNPRAAAGVAALADSYSRTTSAEFSGSWNVTPLVATKADGSFYSTDELQGTQLQTIADQRPLSEQTYIGVVQHAGESGGQVAEVKADQGGQLFQFNVDLGLREVKAGTAGDDDTLMMENVDAVMDTVFLGAGDDTADSEIVDGQKNTIFTGSGDDTAYANAHDVITGGTGNDMLNATSDLGGNRLSGNAGFDVFNVSGSRNRILGGANDDIINVLDGAGTNYLNGGSGADQFWLVRGPGDLPAAKQFVMDFKAGEDLVGLRGASFSDLSFTQMGADTLLNVSGTSIGHFTGVSAAALNNQANFVFA